MRDRHIHETPTRPCRGSREWASAFHYLGLPASGQSAASTKKDAPRELMRLEIHHIKGSPQRRGAAERSGTRL